MHCKLLYSQLQFTAEKGYKVSQGRKPRKGSKYEDSVVLSSWIYGQCDFLSADVSPYAQNIATQGSSPKLWCPEFLLGLDLIPLTWQPLGSWN